MQGRIARRRTLVLAVVAMTLAGVLPAAASDDKANAAYAATAGQFKVIHAYPSDRPNRFAQWACVLQADASLAESYVSLQQGSSRAPRYDMGTSCGAQYPDIQTVALPGPRSSYIDNFGAVRSYVASVVNQAPGGSRNDFVLADTLGSGLAANAMVVSDDRPGADNQNNAGGLYSMMWIPDATNPPAGGSFWPSAMLHEMTHEMGGVQGSAPHSTGGFHCWDGSDLDVLDAGGDL